jgi:hypothetical protein
MQWLNTFLNGLANQLSALLETLGMGDGKTASGVILLIATAVLHSQGMVTDEWMEIMRASAVGLIGLGLRDASPKGVEERDTRAAARQAASAARQARKKAA